MKTIQARAQSHAQASIPDRIAARAGISPQRPAVVDQLRRLTYAELERESNQLAEELRDAGAGPERCVGLLLGRSSQFVVGALAILKSGAAYVPLDSSTPPGRTHSILTDAGVVALVSDSCLTGSLPSGPWQTLAIDQLADRAESFAPVTIDPESLAYCIYTSGSTGRPKGVEVTHANLCNLIEWHQSAFSVTADDRASQVAGFGFDAAGWEIWPYVTAGASVHIADETTRRSPETLRDWLVAQRITIGFVPTVLAEQLLPLDWPSETALRSLLTGGDTLQRRPPVGLPFALVNNYGPTECTVVATSGTVSPEGYSTERPSIGRPITNAIALILDESSQPADPGAPGELCIGGSLVARGYHNMPALTAKQFVTRVTPSGEPLRFYRTGDRVRLLETGEIDFLGRFDDQVKIRGYRIELGEVAACLNRHPKIAASTVVLTQGASGEPSLVAYVVPSADAKLTDRQLRQYLAAELPDYMIPSWFVSVRELPVMASGKLDKAALPAPSAENILPTVTATNGELHGVEEQIADLVASLMNRPSIGADENFFLVGGHSMFGVQLVARIREAFGVKLPLRHVFTAPTVRELSTEVQRLIATG